MPCSAQVGSTAAGAAVTLKDTRQLPFTVGDASRLSAVSEPSEIASPWADPPRAKAPAPIGFHKPAVLMFQPAVVPPAVIWIGNAVEDELVCTFNSMRPLPDAAEDSPIVRADWLVELAWAQFQTCGYVVLLRVLGAVAPLKRMAQVMKAVVADTGPANCCFPGRLYFADRLALVGEDQAVRLLL